MNRAGDAYERAVFVVGLVNKAGAMILWLSILYIASHFVAWALAGFPISDRMVSPRTEATRKLGPVTMAPRYVRTRGNCGNRGQTPGASSC